MSFLSHARLSTSCLALLQFHILWYLPSLRSFPRVHPEYFPEYFVKINFLGCFLKYTLK